MGIVVTMGHIDGPPSEIGHMVGAALVGTFLGILMSYGFAAPLVARLISLGHAEMGFFRTIASIIVGFADNLPPKVAIDLPGAALPASFAHPATSSMSCSKRPKRHRHSPSNV